MNEEVKISTINPISEPFRTTTDQISNKIEVKREFIAIEYKPDFNIADLHPEVGDIFTFYIQKNYFLNKYKPISDGKAYGSTYYSPNSDIAAIASHFGILFQYHKRKNAPMNGINVIKNTFEVSLSSENEHTKKANVFNIPNYVDIKGVVLSICIDRPLEKYPQVKRTWFKSRESTDKYGYSLRISNFYFISPMEEIPKLVNYEDYVRERYKLPKFLNDDKAKISIEYSPDFFKSLISRLNIAQGIFNVYRIILSSKTEKMELSLYSRTSMKLSKFEQENFSEDDISKRKDIPCTEFIKFEHNEIKFKSNGILIRDSTFLEIVSISLHIIRSKKKTKKDQLIAIDT